MTLLLGIFAVMVTPREEEPQINVTMTDVLIPFPGAAVRDVAQMVAGAGTDHRRRARDVGVAARPGPAVITVQFKVGVPRTETLVRLYTAVHSNADWLPKSPNGGLGVLAPASRQRASTMCPSSR